MALDVRPWFWGLGFRGLEFDLYSDGGNLAPLRKPKVLSSSLLIFYRVMPVLSHPV